MKTTHTPQEDHQHADPLTGEPGSHPVGTGVGATVGGVALGVIGAVAGPVGAVVGVTVGAVLGGLSGKGFAEGYDPTVEDAYWRENHDHQPFAKTGGRYDDYAQAYRTGHSGYRPGKTFEEREADLQMEYEGGTQKPEAEHEADAARHAAADTMEGNLHTTRVGDDTDDGATSPSMADNMRSHSLEWYSAREAARAAYQRMQDAEHARQQTGSKMVD